MDKDSQPNAQPPSGGQTPPTDYSKPVAWDEYGRPLYAHPPEAQPQQFVHIARSINPVEQKIDPAILQKYEDSRKKYPNLNLSKGEYIITAVKRHVIGIFQIWFVVAAIIVTFGGLLGTLFFGGATESLSMFGDSADITGLGAAVMILFFALAIGGGFIATYIYNANRFYLTNESVIQEIQTGIFSQHEQTVSLANIEDASYKQHGIIQQMFNYGTIRLSTEGDETTYRFTYVSNPKRHIATLNNAVEAFKNGRPVVND
ncbi:MAG TPA: PH domain-containing protein [Candidatus Saccharimonadales bacterium]|nr:PH domain-containing protein [Candidatus Saccharimonadales bacterium]